MLAGRFDCGSHGTDYHRVFPGSRDDILQRHAAGCHRAGLVEYDGVDATGVLEHLGTADQDSELSAAAGADEQSGRRSQAERAGAGDDQHGHRCREGSFDIAGHEDPHDERGQRNDDDDRHEHARNPVCESLHGCLAALRLRDQSGHVRELSVDPHASGSHGERAIDVHRGTRDGITGPHLKRHRLPGQQRGVDRTLAQLDHAVSGDALTGAYDESITHAQGSGGRADLDAIDQDGRIGGSQAGERSQRLGRATLGACLEPAAGQ